LGLRLDITSIISLPSSQKIVRHVAFSFVWNLNHSNANINSRWKAYSSFDDRPALANDLGLTVDTSCDRDDSKCVAKLVNKYDKNGSGNILICWEYDALTDIVEALGDDNPPTYPDDS
jgi:hypothetical protein